MVLSQRLFAGAGGVFGVYPYSFGAARVLVGEKGWTVQKICLAIWLPGALVRLDFGSFIHFYQRSKSLLPFVSIIRGVSDVPGLRTDGNFSVALCGHSGEYWVGIVD